MVPSYLIYCFFVGNQIFNYRFNTSNIPDSEITLLTGYLFLFYGSGLVLFIVQLLVIITSIMLYQHFGEGIKHIRSHLKKQILARESHIPRNSHTSSHSDFRGLLVNPSESEVTTDEDEVNQAEEMFQEIFQNTLERAHQVGSLEDQTPLYKVLMGEEAFGTTVI